MLYWVIFLFHIVIMPLAAFHALIYKRDHRAALGWMGIIILFPLAGPLIYFVFGINRLRSKAKLFSGRNLPFMSFGYERAGVIETGNYQDALVDQLDNKTLAIIGGRVSGAKLSSQNEIEILKNGDEFFPHLIAKIDTAKQYVLLATYLFGSKGVGGEVAEALSRASNRGVNVFVLIDGVGSLYSLRKVIKPLKKSGVEVALFLPPALIPFSFSINLRNHRKIAVIDGFEGYFGGTNIDQRHMLEDENNRYPTEDMHFYCKGPVVSSLQKVFSTDWHRTTKKQLSLAQYSSGSGSSICRVIDDGPEENLDHLAMVLHGVFSSAEKEIVIMTPYFLPSREMVTVLQSAKLRGVNVKIILPEKSNLRSVDWACRNMLWELLIWGIEVYLKPSPFAHTKLIAIDDEYVMAGSANIDARSLRLNFELGVEIFDKKVLTEVKAHLHDTSVKSRRLELQELDNRRLWTRSRDAIFWLFSSYL